MAFDLKSKQKGKEHGTRLLFAKCTPLISHISESYVLTALCVATTQFACCLTMQENECVESVYCK